MAATLLFFIKLGPSIGHGHSIAADKFLLEIHIKSFFVFPRSPQLDKYKIKFSSVRPGHIYAIV